MAVPNKVLELVERFRENESVYRSPDYKEAHIRQDFIDPFFAELGWDLRNEQNASEVYKEVIFEDAIKVGGSTKAPDYCFRVGGNRKFFVEAKKPSVNLADSVSAAFQVRRYGWSAKLPVSILTDFEEFAVYDCRVMPNKQDKSTTARSLYLPYTDYGDQWNEIYDLFSKEAVLAGSLEQFADGHKQRKGTTTVDAAFLKEIETWRERLAIALSSSNPDLSSRELNFAVQMTINRLIFLRICEDRGIEPYEQLRSLTGKAEVYQQLCGLFRQADDRYNSGLFHFKPEKGRLEADEFTLTLTLADAPLQQIIQNFYYPDSPYEFSVIPIEILGQVYEQFLGKVIRLTSTQEAVIEDKPEVRKAGGVYYTPTYIVDYIVENTIGRSLAGKTPKQAEKIRVLDPACGSGSFLIGAYQFLLNWYLQQYGENPTKYKKQLYQGSGGDWRLTSAEKKRILLNHIHGVDIDLQAVETTKLSLLLKVLEGESQETLFKQLSLLQERALPDLENNIKCGNALIGSDYYDNVQINLLDEEKLYRINVFNWEKSFPEIIKGGGFNAVIGNPPYLRIQGLQEYYGEQVDYFIAQYASAVKRFDLYLLFLEKGFNLLKEDGILGIICPHKFTHADFGSGIRRFLVNNSALESFISFGENLIFSQATTYTGLVFLQKTKNTSFTYSEFPNISAIALPAKLKMLQEKDFASYELKKFSDSPWILTHNITQTILNKLSLKILTLGDVFDEILVGVQAGVDEIHVLKAINEPVNSTPHHLIKLLSEKTNTVVDIETGLVKPFLRGEDIHRYEEPKHYYYCIYPYRLVDNKTKIIEEIELKTEFPLGYSYLEQYREELTEIRTRLKTNPKYWYSCHRSRDMRVFESKRIITPQISLGCNMTLCSEGIYHNSMPYSLLPCSSRAEQLQYWLGLLNSKLLWWFLASTGNVLRGGYFRFKTNYLKPFPVHTINFNNPTEKAKHDRIVQLVEQMLALHQQLAEAKTPPQKSMIQKQINVSDRQIDQLVYELYELTAEEIAIVEGK